ncbi:MAG: hypothetical protein WBN22_13295 [Verrucomicrobiia bacterium]
MLSRKSNWCLITTYKENYLLLPAILSYYRDFYGIQHFLIFCGLTGTHTHETLKQSLCPQLPVIAPPLDKTLMTPGHRELTVSEFSAKDFVLWVASYPTSNYSADLEWTAIRSDLEKWAHRFLPAQISRTILIDNDEFLYVNQPGALEALDGLGFHFIDIVPCAQWPPERLVFSLQGWYYHRQAQPLFKYGGPLMIKLARRLRRGLHHGGCKTFYFDRDRLGNGTAWRHGGTEQSFSCCFALDHFLGDTRHCHKILRDTACCYHLGMTSRDHYFSQKLHLFARIQTDMKRKPVPNAGRSSETLDLRKAQRTFDRFMKESRFPVIEDNFLLPFLQTPMRVEAER